MSSDAVITTRPRSAIDYIFAAKACPNIVTEQARQALADDPFRICETLKSGGFTAFEVALRDTWALKLLDKTVGVCENLGMYVGMGSIITDMSAKWALDQGVHFLVSPGFYGGIARTCAHRQIPYLAGAATSTEIGNLLRLGITDIKYHPALDPETLAEIRASTCGLFPRARIIAAGMKKPEGSINLWAGYKKWYAPGKIAEAFVLASAIFPKTESALRESWWRQFEQNVAEAKRQLPAM